MWRSPNPPGRITGCPLAHRSQDKIETSRYYDVVNFARRVPRRLRGVAGPLIRLGREDHLAAVRGSAAFGTAPLPLGVRAFAVGAVLESLDSSVQ
ncbi:MAG: hypothetical protein IPM24_19745 [Bryobacterales bacterium]|nr:hypothetical protein [Bryobacterales bacterium]